tara:strand:+ start:1443 stop:1691 length:249 start_codon:yes stop_codon:yes gene_type:complete
MKIKILTFANIKNYTDDFFLEIENTDSTTLEILKEKILEREPSMKEILHNVAFAINQEYCTDKNHQINDLDEVALIPPVSGG